MSEEFVAVAKTSEVPEKKVVCVKAHNHALALCQVKGEFFAVQNQCSHALATFDGGRMRAHRIMCPLHGGTFDVRTGEATGQPAKTPITTYPTRVTAQGVIEVNLPQQQNSDN